MANQIIPVNPSDITVIASGGDTRQLTVFGDDDTRQTRNGVPLIQLRATVLLRGQSLGEIAVQTSEADFAGIASGDVLTVSGEAEAKFAGTQTDWDLRTSVYAQHLQPTGVNAWNALADVVKRAQAQAAK